MKIFIITEGGDHIGFGHITRCVSLYQAFEKSGLTPEFVVNGGEAIKDVLKNQGYKIFNWLDQKNRLFENLNSADICVVDSYLADMDFYKKVSNKVKVPVYMDDNKRHDYPRGIVVNGSIYADKIDYPDKEGLRYLLGTKYVPLRKEFWGVSRKKIKEKIETVMVTFGGDDDKNMTPKVLKFLNQEYPSLSKKVVIGRVFQNIKEIEGVKDKNTDLIYYPNAKRMKKLMLEADLCISAAGQTLYELAREGVPAIAMDVADNQLNNIKGWLRAGFIWYAGHWNGGNIFKKIKISIEEMKDPCVRKDRYRIGRDFVDGGGSSRIVNYLLNIGQER